MIKKIDVKNDSKISRAELRREIQKTVSKLQSGRSLLYRARSFLGLAEKEGKKLLPWSKSSESDTEIAFSDDTYFQKEKGKKELEVLYRNSWAIARAINIRQNLKVARGLKINFENVDNAAKAEKVVTEFIKKIHPSRPMVALLNKFRNIGIDTDVFGNGFWEKLFSPAGTLEKPIPVAEAKSLDGIAPVHPIHLDFKRGLGTNILFENNKPKAFEFSKNQEKYDVEIGRIAHLSYNRIGDELLGMSLIEPMFKTGERLMKIEEGITQSVLTHMPLYDIIVGDEAHPATKEMIDEVCDEVMGLNYKSEFVHPHWIRASQMEAFSLGKSGAYMQPFITAIASWSGVPEFLLLGRGEGTNKATAQAMKDFIFQTIDPLQMQDAMFFEEEILYPLMQLNGIEGVPEIEWNEITPQDAYESAQTVKILSETKIDNQSLISFEEARERVGFGKPALKEGGKKSEMSEAKRDGIYLTEPHGQFIWSGKKSAIVKSKQFLEKVDEQLLLISGNKAYGILKLQKPVEIDLQQFRRLKKFHLISDEERSEWWPDAKKLYFFKFNLLKKFDSPKEVSIPRGIQTFVSNENIKFTQD